MLDSIRTAIEAELKKEKRYSARILKGRVDLIMAELEKILAEHPRYGHVRIYGGDKVPYHVRKYGIMSQSYTSVLEIIWNIKFVMVKWHRKKCQGERTTDKLIVQFFNIPSTSVFPDYDFTLITNKKINERDAINTIDKAKRFVLESISYQLMTRYKKDLDNVLLCTRRKNVTNIKIEHKSFYAVCKFGDETVFVSRFLIYCPETYIDFDVGRKTFFKKVSKEIQAPVSLLEEADAGNESALREINKLEILKNLLLE